MSKDKNRIEKDIYARALAVWGEQSQIIILFEEVAELQKELSKHLRGGGNVDSIAEEIADVEIMLEQMKMLFDIEDRVGQHKSEKIDRLNYRVNECVFGRKTTAPTSIKIPYEEVEKGVFRPKIKRDPKGMNGDTKSENNKSTEDLTINIEIEPINNKALEGIKQSVHEEATKSISEVLSSVMAKSNKEFYG